MIFKFTEQEKETLREIEQRYYEERAQAIKTAPRDALIIRIKYTQDFQKALKKIEKTRFSALQGKPDLILKDAQERAEDSLYYAADFIANDLFISNREREKNYNKSGEKLSEEQTEPATFLADLIGDPDGETGTPVFQYISAWDWDTFRGMTERIKDHIIISKDSARKWIYTEILPEHISALKGKKEGETLARFISDLLERLPFVKALEGVGDPGSAELPAEENLKSNNVIYKPYFLTRHGALTDSLIHVDPNSAEYNEHSNSTEMRDFANSMTLLFQDIKLGKGRSFINAHKLLMLAVGEFTRLNNRNVVTVAVPLDEVLRAMQYKIEKKSAKKAARNRLKKDLKILHSVRVALDNESFSLLNIFEYISIKDGYILFDFSLRASAILRRYPLNYYPTALLGIDQRKETAYKLGVKMFTHFNIDNNQIRETSNRLKVSTLLASSGLPTIEELREKKESRHWDSRIKEPFESALDELTGEGKLLKEWEYVKPKGIKLTDEEAANITDYETFSNLLLRFEFEKAPDHTERLEKKEAEKIEAEKKKEEQAETKKKKKRG